MMVTAPAHRVTLVRITSDRGGRTRVVAFRAECSCGEGSSRLSTAGMVAGWEANHREQKGDLTDEHTHRCPGCNEDWTCRCPSVPCLFDGKVCDVCQLAHLEQEGEL
jgi:hypothetical protein